MGEAAIEYESDRRELTKWEWRLLQKIAGWKDVYHPIRKWQREVAERLAEWGYLNRLDMFSPVPYRINAAGRRKLSERPSRRSLT